jgi:hypothetical protein
MKCAMPSTVRNVCFSLCYIIAAATTATAQETTSGADTVSLRPVSSTWSAEVGSSHLADTYLTPLKYSGTAYALNYSRRQAMAFSPRKWVQMLWLHAEADRTTNPLGNVVMWRGNVAAQWAMVRRWQITPAWSAGIGGNVRGDFGALYLRRNSNNPAQAQAAVTVGLTGYIQWQTKMFHRVPLAVRWTPSVPLCGAFFAPDYGELYYEIYLGNHSNLAHFAWPVSYRALYSDLTADVAVSESTSLSVGYSATVVSTKANNITSRTIKHALQVGVTCRWTAYNPTKASAVTSAILADY